MVRCKAEATNQGFFDKLGEIDILCFSPGDRRPAFIEEFEPNLWYEAVVDPEREQVAGKRLTPTGSPLQVCLFKSAFCDIPLVHHKHAVAVPDARGRVVSQRSLK